MNKARMQIFENRHIRTSAGQAQLTISETDDMLELPKKRVRKIEAKALLKLKIKLTNAGIGLQDLI